MKKLLFAALLFTGCSRGHFRTGDCVAVYQTNKFGFIAQINGDGSIVVKQQDGWAAVLPSEEGLTALPSDWCDDLKGN